MYAPCLSRRRSRAGVTRGQPPGTSTNPIWHDHGLLYEVLIVFHRCYWIDALGRRSVTVADSSPELARSGSNLLCSDGRSALHSARRACMTSTRAARAAGSQDATTAAVSNTNAESTTGNAPGILTSRK